MFKCSFSFPLIAQYMYAGRKSFQEFFIPLHTPFRRFLDKSGKTDFVETPALQRNDIQKLSFRLERSGIPESPQFKEQSETYQIIRISDKRV